ncbi:MAG: MBOAT family protein [Elusimicrobia bacterium]|nr:MBOAT family protein [Elusimicrobiota bacterium]
MLFNSVHFLIFFPIVTFLYFLLPMSRRWALLLAASCYFYMAFIPAYILVLFALILVDYAAALWMERHEGLRRRAILFCSIASNLAMLGLFKYFNFFNANFHQLAHWLHLPYQIQDSSLILPIGLSFHTFQSMSYTIEVYRGAHKAERHLGLYALYVMFYPQLVAGPIERPGLLDQFRRRHFPDAARIGEGLRLMLTGFFKKVAIADTLAITVNAVYLDPSGFSAASRLVAIYFFSFQILYDFSGYSDIARGAAKVMGFDLMINFDRPYAAKTISEFWRRWHISLSTWFRDYLYISLGGSRVDRPRRYFNLLVVFLVSGFWHGANWTFIAWGAIHGCFLIASDAVSTPMRKLGSRLAARAAGRRIWSLLGVLLTFHFVAFAWIFFRASSLAQARWIVVGLFARYDWRAAGQELGGGIIAVSILLIAVMEAAQWIRKNVDWNALLPAGTLLRESALYAWVFALLAVIAARVAYDASPQQFIYFQF